MSAQRADRGDGDYETPIAAPASAGQALFQLDQFLPYRINVLANLISLALSRVYSRYRIGVPEWRVLVVLGEYGVMNGKAVSINTHMHKTKVSRAVAVLERRKLVARRVNREDMRESLLSLTPPGRAMYEELAPHALDFARRLADIVAPGDRAAFYRALKQLTDRTAQLVAEMAADERD
jgi:DNA-binding MarR family transcriptional regulator